MFAPLRNMVLFAAVEYEDKSKGGIIAPGDYKSNNGPSAEVVSKPKRARVIAVGPGKYFTTGGFRETYVKPGDYCQLMANAFLMTVMINGEILYLTEDDYIAGTFGEEDVSLQVLPDSKPEEKSRIHRVVQ